MRNSINSGDGFGGSKYGSITSKGKKTREQGGF